MTRDPAPGAGPAGYPASLTTDREWKGRVVFGVPCTVFGGPRERGLGIVAACVLLAAPCAAAGAEGRERIQQRLDYSLRVWKGFRALGRTVGAVTVETGEGAFGDRPCGLLRVRTRARLFRFRVDATTRSFLDPQDGRQLAFHYLRTGNRRVESRLLFRPSGIEYHKRLPAGEPPTLAWEPLAGHPYEPRIRDMFAAFYAAKVEGIRVGGPPRTLRCVADRKLWDVAFRAAARETIAVPAGTFDTLRLEIAPSPANDYTRTIRFRGPFALGANTRFWVDPATGILVKLAGTAHLTVAVRAEMRLLRVTPADAGAE